MNRKREYKITFPSLFIIMKPGLHMVMLFFFAFCLVAPEIPAQLNTSYRIQIKALDRVKIDSVKMLCNVVADQLDMAVFILDQDNYYKMAVGNFSSFRQASEKLEFISSFYHDAWIITDYNEFVIFSVDPKQVTDELPEKPQETEMIDYDDAEIPVQDPGDISEPITKEPLPVEISEEVDEPVADTSDLVKPEPIIEAEKPERKKLFWKLYGSGVYIDLHASDPETRYCTYNGFGAGVGVFYAITKNLALDLSASYSMANAMAIFEKHDLSGNASVIMVNPSFIAGTDFFSRHGIYGKVGAGYFNYDYAYKLELKPGFSGGPASVETELLERAVTYGLDVGIGIRVFRHFDASMNAWFDQNSRRFYRVNLGLVF
ncbi:MAG: hypothetical protein IH597_13425 [Bacteroidales bacterium]|nr:hypothetical protein [Bacteroidales bacterium]